MTTISPDPTSTATARELIARFWRGWLGNHTGKLIGATALLALVAAASSVYPLLVGAVVDALAALSGGQNRSRWFAPETIAWAGPVAVIAATLVRGLALYGATVLTNRVALRATTDLQRDLFAKLLSLDFARLAAEPSGSFAARFLNDVNAIREAVLRAANSFVRDVLTLVGVVGAMLMSDWQLAVVALVILPLAIGPVTAIGARLRKTATLAQEQAGELSGVVEESLGGVRLVKAFGMEPIEARRVGRSLNFRRGLLLYMAEQKGRVDPILEVLGGIAVAGVFGFAAFRISGGAASVGDLMAFITALLLAAQSVRSLGGLNSVLQEGFAALQRFYAVLDEVPSIADRPGARPLPEGGGRVAFENVSFAYPVADGQAGTPVLQGVSFVAEPGKTIALVGPSGAGKSSVLNLIPRLYDVTGGTVMIDGHDVRKVTLDSLRTRIALVSQDATLFDATIAENVAMGRPDASREDIELALAAAACDFAFKLPAGMDSPAGPRGHRLSGGERQRVALARAILRDAPILLLDEPTSALDSESEARIQEALDSFSTTRTTLVVAHRLATVRKADEILVFEQGRIVERGTHDSLLALGGVYAELAALQFADV
jgi:ATP-binding cassette, subfamily B, bacterial MsbA